MPIPKVRFPQSAKTGLAGNFEGLDVQPLTVKTTTKDGDADFPKCELCTTHH